MFMFYESGKRIHTKSQNSLQLKIKTRTIAPRFVYTWYKYRGADKSLPRPTSRCILFDGGNISFDASLVLYI